MMMRLREIFDCFVIADAVSGPQPCMQSFAHSRPHHTAAVAEDSGRVSRKIVVKPVRTVIDNDDDVAEAGTFRKSSGNHVEIFDRTPASASLCNFTFHRSSICIDGCNFPEADMSLYESDPLSPPSRASRIVVKAQHIHDDDDEEVVIPATTPSKSRVSSKKHAFDTDAHDGGGKRGARRVDEGAVAASIHSPKKGKAAGTGLDQADDDAPAASQGTERACVSFASESDVCV